MIDGCSCQLGDYLKNWLVRYGKKGPVVGLNIFNGSIERFTYEWEWVSFCYPQSQHYFHNADLKVLMS